MCNERVLDQKERATAIKLKAQRPAYPSEMYEAWERDVAKAIEKYGMGGGAAHEFCDLAGVP
jgi:hypothetical protein